VSHYSDEEWVDFVRSLLAEESKAAMQDHLARGCPDCTDAFRTWKAVQDCANAEPSYAVPADTLNSATAAYKLEKTWKWVEKFAAMARLVFDSARQPALAAVRASGSSSRHLMHEAEPYIIDLQLQGQQGHPRIALIGQVLDSRAPDRRINGIDVLLISGDDIVARNSANDSGEFTLEYEPVRDLRLFINIRGQRAIGLVLPD
jgi:hypothetical protein